MSQRLILPINKCRLTASWKTDSYRNKFGFTHYGADMVSTAGFTTVYASGVGEVVATGYDSVVGNVVAVRYLQAKNRVTGIVQDVILRYFHLASIAVKQGDTVIKDTKLGNYGNTGSLQGMAIHLHIEADADAEHPIHSPTVQSSSLLKGRAAGANDKTMTNPLEWLYLKTDAPDNQTFTTTNDAYIRAEDKTIPQITSALTDDSVRIEGIDVSAHNGGVDFKKVKAAGKDFVFVRLGWAGWDGRVEANGGLDKRFHENVKGAIAAGLNVGVYVYSYCKTPEAARVAALETLELVKPYKLTYPIAFDIEDTSDSGTRYDKMSKSENSAICNAFLNEIKQADYAGMLYTYKSFAENYLDMSALSEWEVWIAQYANSCTYNGAYGIWQYAGDVKGFCPGVIGACDLNVSYKDYAALIAESGLNGFGGSDAFPQEPSNAYEIERLQEQNAKLWSEIVELNAQVAELTKFKDKIERIREILV